MRYRQDTSLKSDRKKIIGSQGGKISQVIFDKEITQEWQVKTNEPTEILPYLLKRICLSRKCEFWHQMKFFYFENYEEITKNQYEEETWAKESNLLEDWEESVILVRVTPERIEESKRFIKTLWKITRQRLMNSINKIKHHAGMEDESSLELEDEKLNSYMRFLKLQENKRIDIAIETLDSVIEKNTKKKLLNGFLNMRERLKEVKRQENYRDRIKLECFVDIVMRSIRRGNMGLVKSAFEGIELKGEFVRRKLRHQSKSSEMMRKAESAKKIEQSEVEEITQRQESDTINKQKRRTETPLQSHEKQTNNQSTIKREIITTTKENEQNKNNHNIINKNNSSKRNLHNDSEIKSISSHEQVVESQYYYEEVEGEGMEDVDGNNYGREDENIEERQYHEEEEFNINRNFNNNLPTRRAYHHHQRHNNNNINYNIINESEQQKHHYETHHNNEQHININKKTARTPSRITQNFYHSQNLESEHENNNIKENNKNTRSQHETANKVKYRHEELHIPITQRIEKHFYEEHYEEEEEEVNDDHDDEELSSNDNNNNVHQQICVIRNMSSTPQRKPDRYEKIPIVSNNIEFRQFFINSNKKKTNKIEISTHSTSYYENKCCEGCQYCTRLKKINEMMTLLHQDKHVIEKTQIETKIDVIRDKNTIEKASEREINLKETNEINHNSKKVSEIKKEIHLISKTEQLNAFTKKNSQDEKVSSTKIIMDSSKVSKESKEEQPKLENTTSRKVNYSKDEKPSSTLGDIRRSGFTPSRQSLMTKSTYSKGLSERKMFSRKPMY